jgi:hypothetical protein
MALATYPNFFKEMQAQAKQLIQPLAALASLLKDRPSAQIKTKELWMHPMVPDPLCEDHRPLKDAVLQLKMRLQVAVPFCCSHCCHSQFLHRGRLPSVILEIAVSCVHVGIEGNKQQVAVPFCLVIAATLNMYCLLHTHTGSHFSHWKLSCVFLHVSVEGEQRSCATRWGIGGEQRALKNGYDVPCFNVKSCSVLELRALEWTQPA